MFNLEFIKSGSLNFYLKNKSKNNYFENVLKLREINYQNVEICRLNEVFFYLH